MRKKVNLFFAALMLSFMLAVGVQTTYASEPVYSVTINFNANGGSGTMDKVVVMSNQPTNLPGNTFTKSGYQFKAWSDKKDGSGATYADKADVTALATESSTEITLYAQWEVAAPKIKTAKSTVPSYIKVTFDKCKTGSGYQIQYSTSKKFTAKTTNTTTVSKSVTSAKLLRVTPNKKYYIRMRIYKGKTATDETAISGWSSVKTVKVKNGKTIANTKCTTAIEADVILSGSGTGYHAKVMMGSEGSGVSFGIQYDSAAAAPYTGKAMALIENISTNAAGGQSYERPGNVELKRKKTYHIMMTTDGKGNVNVYVDYKKIGSCYQPNLAVSLNFVRIEASGRLNGDTVDVQFSNIKYKIASNAPLRVLGDDLKWAEIKENQGLKYKYDKKNNVIRLYGTMTGLNGDWDSDYEGASEILQFEY